MRSAFAALLILAAATPAAAQAVPAAVSQLALGHRLAGWFDEGRMDSIVARMAPEVREKSGGADGLRQARAELADRAGEKDKLLEEKMTRRKGLAQYWRAAMHGGFPDEPIVMRWLFNEKSEVVGFGLAPLSQTPPPDGEEKAP
jgi:hypothetical protein